MSNFKRMVKDHNVETRPVYEIIIPVMGIEIFRLTEIEANGSFFAFVVSPNGCEFSHADNRGLTKAYRSSTQCDMQAIMPPCTNDEVDWTWIGDAVPA